MKSAHQLTDDAIGTFVGELVSYLERHPATFENFGWMVSDEGYDNLREFCLRALEPFSNGYVNYN